MQCLLQILGTFSNGRVESWIHMRPLKPEEMCEKSNAGCIAQRLATFHAAKIHDIHKEPQVFQRLLTWYSKSLAACMLNCSISGNIFATTVHRFASTVSSWCSALHRFAPQQLSLTKNSACLVDTKSCTRSQQHGPDGACMLRSVLLRLMTSAERCPTYAVRLDEAEALKYQDAGKQKAKEAKDFSAMRSEVLEMQKMCEQLQSPVVFAHNDLLSGNIMIPLDVSWLLHLHGIRIVTCYAAVAFITAADHGGLGTHLHKPALHLSALIFLL